MVEDNDAVRTSLVEVLRQEGYSTLEAPDGLAAREVLETHSVDVVILDLGLPVLDGPGLLADLDECPPVVVLSGFANGDQDEIVHRLGGKVAAFICKPSPPHVVVAAIEGVAQG